MEIPEDVLEQLKCNSCNNYLSCSPVYLQHNGFTVCGQCYNMSRKKNEEKANRMLQYEIVAKMLKFPCKNKIHGCKEVVPFIGEYQECKHEKVCKFRNIPCPIYHSTNCHWMGQTKQILEHFKNKHPNHVEHNPCILQHDMTQFSIKTYIIHCFDLLFLLYTKVCLATGKIFHAVQLLNDPDEASEFKYTLQIQREELIISRPGKVIERNCNIDEHSSVVTNITSLMDFLNGFNNTIFTIHIKKDPKMVSKKLEKQTQYLEEIIKPSTSMLTLTNDRYCRYRHRGCTFKDIDIKCDKHEELFCSFRNWCWTCWLPPISFKNNNDWSMHNKNNHKRLIFESGKYFPLKSTGLSGHTVFINTTFGQIYCRYFFYNTILKIYIWTPLTNENLKKYNYVLGLKSVPKDNTKDISESFNSFKSFTDRMWDLYTEENPKKLFTNVENLNMCIQINTDK